MTSSATPNRRGALLEEPVERRAREVRPFGDVLERAVFAKPNFHKILILEADEVFSIAKAHPRNSPRSFLLIQTAAGRRPRTERD